MGCDSNHGSGIPFRRTYAVVGGEVAVKPECIYFGKCGGCAYQNVSYSNQLLLKRSKIIESLSAFKDSSEFEVAEVTPSPKPYHYRHSIALTVRKRDDKLKLGYVAWMKDQNTKREDKFFLPIDSCAIADKRLNQFFPKTLEQLESLLPRKRRKISQVMLRVGDVPEVVTSLRPDRGKILKETILGRTFSYSVSSFFQSNHSILESFVKTVRLFLTVRLDSAEPTGKGLLIDLYSGVGLLGISLASDYEQVFLIEEGYEAVEQAKANAEANGARNVQGLCGKAEEIFPGLEKHKLKPLHIIVDPPRAGLMPEVVNRLIDLAADRLIYVSCHIDSLKRDLTLLTKRYQIQKIQPLDFFPQTEHVETIVLLVPQE